MSKTFRSIWIIGAVAIFLVVLLGLAAVSQMALSPNGYVRPPQWLYLSGVALALALYWSALCWAIALLRGRPKVSFLIVVGTLLLAFGVPVVDAAIYARQQAAIDKHNIITKPPQMTGKTALMLWPSERDCTNRCWYLAKHTNARVLLLPGEELSRVDFSKPVDVLDLPLYELGEGLGKPLPVKDAQRPERIDYVLLHEASATHFGPVFDAVRPAGILRHGLHIDALIVPTQDGRVADLGTEQPVLRLMHVSRALAFTPWMLWSGDQVYYNATDRRANRDIARPFFCLGAVKNNTNRCKRAFDSY